MSNAMQAALLVCLIPLAPALYFAPALMPAYAFAVVVIVWACSQPIPDRKNNGDQWQGTEYVARFDEDSRTWR